MPGAYGSYNNYGMGGMNPYSGMRTPSAYGVGQMADPNVMYGQQIGSQMMSSVQGMQAGIIKGRPVSGIEEARASMIDLDGSLFVFTDISNKKIYTKQVLLDGTAELKIYSLEENQRGTEIETKQTELDDRYVLRDDFERAIEEIKKRIKIAREVNEDE